MQTRLLMVEVGVEAPANVHGGRMQHLWRNSDEAELDSCISTLIRVDTEKLKFVHLLYEMENTVDKELLPRKHRKGLGPMII